jgi:hypothetical protein
MGFNSAFKELKKTQKATKCSDHRTTSLIAHIAQIGARILRVRIEKILRIYLEKICLDLKEEKGLQIPLG